MADFVPTRRLIAPKIIETPQAEELIKRRVDDFNLLMDEAGEAYNLQKSDPIYMLFEVESMREKARREEDNYRISQCYVAFGEGENLDALGDLVNIKRREGEPDDTYRQRIIDGNDGYSTAGSYLGYIYHAKSIEVSEEEAKQGIRQESIVDVYPYKAKEKLKPDVEDSPVVEKIFVTCVLKSELKPKIKETIRQKIERKLLSPGVKPLTDIVVVRLATEIHLRVKATISVSASVAESQIREKIRAEFQGDKNQGYSDFMYRANEKLRIDALKSQFYVNGVNHIDHIELLRVEGSEEVPFPLEDYETARKEAIRITLSDKDLTVKEVVRGGG